MVKFLGGVEAIGVSLSSFRLLQNSICVNMVILGQLKKKEKKKKIFINTCVKFESKNPFAYVTHIVWLVCWNISFLFNCFSVRYRFLFSTLRFWPKSPSFTQRSFFVCLFFVLLLLLFFNLLPFFLKTIGLNCSFTLIENNFKLLKWRSLSSR